MKLAKRDMNVYLQLFNNNYGAIYQKWNLA